jgi:hypothetical protein
MMFQELEGNLGSGVLNKFPFVRFYNLYDDPKEEYPLNLTPEIMNNLWVRWGAGPILVEHMESLAKEPVIKPGTPDPYVPAKK